MRIQIPRKKIICEFDYDHSTYQVVWEVDSTEDQNEMLCDVFKGKEFLKQIMLRRTSRKIIKEIVLISIK